MTKPRKMEKRLRPGLSPETRSEALRKEAAALLEQAQIIDEQEKGFANANGEARIRLVADMLHSLTCHHNHTDACAWHYHSWGDTNLADSSARSRYYKRAEKVIAALDGAGVPRDKQQELLLSILEQS